MPEPTLEKSGLAFTVTMLRRGNDPKLLTEAVRRALEISEGRPAETAFTMMPHRYGQQDGEHFDQLRAAITEAIRPGIVERQKAWQETTRRIREEERQNRQRQPMTGIFDEMLRESAAPHYLDDVKLKGDVETAVRAARDVKRPPRQRRNPT